MDAWDGDHRFFLPTKEPAVTISTAAKGKTLSGSFTSEYPVFVEGEIVVLNSGGPNMTVIDVLDDTDELACAFASCEHSIEILVFPTACVRKVVTN